VEYIKSVVSDTKANFISWEGYRKKIDEYYYMLMVEPENVEKPGQEQMKGYFAKIIEILGASVKSGRCKAASCMLDMSGQARDAFNSMIDEALDKQDQKGRILPVSLFGGVEVTVFCNTTNVVLPTRIWMQEHASKRMFIAGKKEWLSLILTFDKEHMLTAVDFENLKWDDIPPDRRARLKLEAEIMRKQEVDGAIAERGRIGRNELCPCGSGQKYKRCCGRNRKR
jgi:hypothetical protein